MTLPIIFIPTRARADRQITADAFNQHGFQTTLVLSDADTASYDPSRYNFIKIKEEGITPTRNAIFDLSARDKFLMMDDDLTFFKRAKTNTCKRLSTLKEYTQLLTRLDKLLDKHPIVGVAERFLINYAPYPIKFGCRQIHVFGFNKKLLPDIRFRGRVFEDMDIVMQCLLKGQSNAVITDFAQQQKKQDDVGGCNTWRTPALEAEENKVFLDRWKGFASPSRDGQKKKMVIHWKRLAQAGKALAQQ